MDACDSCFVLFFTISGGVSANIVVADAVLLIVSVVENSVPQSRHSRLRRTLPSVLSRVVMTCVVPPHSGQIILSFRRKRRAIPIGNFQDGMDN